MYEYALAQIGPAAVSALIEVLKYKAEIVREKATDALRQIGPAAVRP